MTAQELTQPTNEIPGAGEMREITPIYVDVAVATDLDFTKMDSLKAMGVYMEGCAELGVDIEAMAQAERDYAKEKKSYSPILYLREVMPNENGEADELIRQARLKFLDRVRPEDIMYSDNDSYQEALNNEGIFNFTFTYAEDVEWTGLKLEGSESDLQPYVVTRNKHKTAEIESWWDEDIKAYVIPMRQKNPDGETVEFKVIAKHIVFPDDKPSSVKNPHVNTIPVLVDRPPEPGEEKRASQMGPTGPEVLRVSGLDEMAEKVIQFAHLLN